MSNVNSVFDGRRLIHSQSGIRASSRSFRTGPIGEYLKTIGLNKGKSLFGKLYNQMLADQQRTYGFENEVASIDMGGLPGVIMAGIVVEGLEEDVRAVKIELQDTLKSVHSLVNEFLTIKNILEPKIIEQAKSIRSARMSLTTEVATCLSTMKEIRTLLSGPEHMDETKRVKELISLCREVEELRASGTLEAVSELAIKLAVARESK